MMDLHELRNRFTSGGWTVFLDRDGVINKRLYDDYVKDIPEFEFLPGVLEAIARFAEYARKIIVVTNQRGIARGLMNEDDLERIHAYMQKEVQAAGGRIDRIYHCPHDRNMGCGCRKPGIGMPLQARTEMPEINFNRSIMFGDAPSDLQMGRELGMICVQIGPEEVPPEFVDLHLEQLNDFWTISPQD